MILGASILLVGILIGYSIPFWNLHRKAKVLSKRIDGIIKNSKAQIIDTSPDVDLGEKDA